MIRSLAVPFIYVFLNRKKLSTVHTHVQKCERMPQEYSLPPPQKVTTEGSPITFWVFLFLVLSPYKLFCTKCLPQKNYSPQIAFALKLLYPNDSPLKNRTPQSVFLKKCKVFSSCFTKERA